MSPKAVAKGHFTPESHWEYADGSVICTLGHSGVLQKAHRVLRTLEQWCLEDSVPV